MRVSIDWLKEFTELSSSNREIADIFTMLGLEAEEEPALKNIVDIVIGEIIEIDKHPNADRLNLCKVSDGVDEFPVVCGAPNVEKGQKIAFARVGSILPNDIRISKVKIRGEVSRGMICSESELGISDDHDGIMVLTNDAIPGSSLVNHLLNNSSILDLDITPNRADCFSHAGLARDYAVKSGKIFNLPDYKEKIYETDKISNLLSINTGDHNDCPRYIAGIIKNVEVKQSPDWLKKKLESIGHRSINNLVDISNLVMMEMGQPTHIFDFDKLDSKQILVRRGKNGEKITSLDNISHNLTSENLLITDGKKPIAIAGVMGGISTSVTEKTTSILIESAYFSPTTIRKSAKSLGLSTDASKRFERGADVNATSDAFWRVLELVIELAGGEWIPGKIDIYPNVITREKIYISIKSINSYAGCEIGESFSKNVLKGIGCQVEDNINEWICTPPSWRPDLFREVDLIEEVIRFFGYNNIPSKYNYESIMQSKIVDPHEKLDLIVSSLAGLGFVQVFNNSLESDKNNSLLNVSSVSLLNPSSENMNQMRTSLFNGLIKTADYNIKNGNKDLMLFEWGNAFESKGNLIKDIQQKLLLSGLVHGNLFKSSVHIENDKKFDFFSIKGAVENFLKKLLINNYTLIKNELKSHAFVDDFYVKVNSTTIGRFGKISSDLLSGLNVDLKAAYAFEFDLDLIFELLKVVPRYKKIIHYPTIERDINFVLNDDISSDQIISTIINNDKKLLIKVTPVNIFRDKSLGSNKKSLTIKLIFQSTSKTLEDKDVNPLIDEIIRLISKKYSAKLR